MDSRKKKKQNAKQTNKSQRNFLNVRIGQQNGVLICQCAVADRRLENEEGSHQV